MCDNNDEYKPPFTRKVKFYFAMSITFTPPTQRQSNYYPATIICRLVHPLYA